MTTPIRPLVTVPLAVLIAMVATAQSNAQSCFRPATTAYYAPVVRPAPVVVSRAPVVVSPAPVVTTIRYSAAYWPVARPTPTVLYRYPVSASVMPITTAVQPSAIAMRPITQQQTAYSFPVSSAPQAVQMRPAYSQVQYAAPATSSQQPYCSGTFTPPQQSSYRRVAAPVATDRMQPSSGTQHYYETATGRVPVQLQRMQEEVTTSRVPQVTPELSLKLLQQRVKELEDEVSGLRGHQH